MLPFDGHKDTESERVPAAWRTVDCAPFAKPYRVPHNLATMYSANHHMHHHHAQEGWLRV